MTDDERRRKQREYMRAYRATYLPRKRELANAARASDPQKALARERAYRAKRRAQIKAKYSEWVRANKDRVRAIRAAYRERNREDLRASNRAYQRANPAVVSARAMKRHADRIRATPPWSDLDAVRAIYEQCARISRETGVKHHVDHIVPLRGRIVCGLHVAHNLQVIPATENHRKSNKLIAA